MTIQTLVKDCVRQSIVNSANMAVISIADPNEAAAVNENLSDLNARLQAEIDKWFAQGESNG